MEPSDGREPARQLPQDTQPGRYYGNGLPYVAIAGYPGKIIAIEGTDGVGRSTQIRLLREWLEVKGYGPVVAPRALRLRHRPAPRLLSEAGRRHAGPARAAGPRTRLLGIGHGHEARRRYLRQLPHLPARGAARVCVHGG